MAGTEDYHQMIDEALESGNFGYAAALLAEGRRSRMISNSVATRYQADIRRLRQEAEAAAAEAAAVDADTATTPDGVEQTAQISC